MGELELIDSFAQCSRTGIFSCQNVSQKVIFLKNVFLSIFFAATTGRDYSTVGVATCPRRQPRHDGSLRNALGLFK